MSLSKKREVAHDTLHEIHAQQAEQERLLKEANRVRAAQLLTRYAAERDWSDDDVAEVKGALGI